MIAIYLRWISLCYICDGFVVRGWIMSEIEIERNHQNIYCVSSSIVDDKVVAMFSEHMNSSVPRILLKMNRESKF